jgi:LmbE family N-acetylglucosaminyl deacetylase
MINRIDGPLKIAVIAAHPDDEAIGMGGALLKFKQLGYEVHLLFISDGITSRSGQEKIIIDARRKNFQQAMSFLSPSSYQALEYPDNKLDSIPLLEIVQKIEEFLYKVRPDMLFTHFIDDLNIDHQIVSKSSVVATRPGSRTFVKEILCFEVLSSTDWNLGRRKFAPNYYIDISDFIEKKILYMSAYKDEIKQYPHARSIENIKALSQIRGSEVFTSNAEGFILLRSFKDVF